MSWLKRKDNTVKEQYTKKKPQKNQILSNINPSKIGVGVGVISSVPERSVEHAPPFGND